MKKTYDNTKSFSVRIEVLVTKGATLAQDTFQRILWVTSPKTGTVLRDVRFDYLNESETIYLSDGVDGRATADKILAQFDAKAVRKPNITKYHDRLVAMVDLTAQDLYCCLCAHEGWTNRQQDYVD